MKRHIIEVCYGSTLFSIRYGVWLFIVGAVHAKEMKMQESSLCTCNDHRIIRGSS